MGNESLEIYNGLPQGSCLSPTLFNIYTLGLHGINNQSIKTFQFADDFIILSAEKDFDAANNILQNKMNEFIRILKSLNLSANTEKTVVMYVAKGARKIPQIRIEGIPINSVDKINFWEDT